MIKSDGFTREQFLPLWHDAMWSTPSLNERTRMVLELGRLEVRELKTASPLVVAYVEGLERPFVLLPLPEPPTVKRPDIRGPLAERLADMGASEVYVLMTVHGGKFGGVQNYLLSAWGESNREGAVDAACWVMPFRWKRGLEEAAPLPPPTPRDTEIAKNVAGLLSPRH